MRAVSNTSPLSNLALVGHLHLLAQQFEEICIPDAVVTELQAVKGWQGIDAIDSALEAGWICPKSVRDRNLVRSLVLDLDLGEAEAIALALQEGYSRVLIDESDGRRIARQVGLEPVGVLGVLLRAKKDGTLPSVTTVMTALQEVAGFYIRSDLFREIAVLAGEEDGG